MTPTTANQMSPMAIAGVVRVRPSAAWTTGFGLGLAKHLGGTTARRPEEASP